MQSIYQLRFALVTGVCVIVYRTIRLHWSLWKWSDCICAL